MDLGLKSKKVLITGASQGIGEGAARVFAAEGADLKLTARRGDVLDSLAANLKRETGVSVETFPIDLELRGAAQKLADAAGDVDILVNNAGVIPGGNLEFVDEKTWRAGWELKVFGYINLCRIYYARMKASGGGVIVNNIGNAGERLDAEYISGTSGNACLMAFTRALGGPSLGDGIRVVGINPGPVDTPRIYKLLRQRAKEWFGDESRWKELQARYPKGRPASVAEICDAMAFLASDRSGYTSGAILTIDGGIASRSSII
ncbi:MAG: SDR family oxidoreductase [Albidovulum sp.]|nr:SDR family oxidoreductase [Albidovulum sp.]